jgi:aryl-alcohol dehydrogenase
MGPTAILGEMKMQGTAAVLRQPNKPYTIEPISFEAPRPGEILIRIHAVGICHTDMVFASGAMGSPFPLILGHEGAGVVEQIGEGVTKVAPGQKVLLTFNSCGHCSQCHQSNPAYCHEFVALNFACVRPDGSSSARDRSGPVAARFFGQSSFASHAIAQERNVIRLPDDADLTSLAPLGCGIQTGVGAVLRSLNAQAGSTLVVLGGGAVGLSAVLGGKIAGCSTILVIEPLAARRQLALELGAHHAIDPESGDTAEQVKAILPQGANNIVDTSGNVGAISASLSMLAPHGTLGLVGVPGSLEAVLPLPIVPAITFGYTIKGIIEGDSDPDEFLPELIALHAAGKLPIERFSTVYPFEQINQAIADSHSGKCVKAILELPA